MRIADIVKSKYLAPFDSEVILSHLLHCDRSWILAHPEYSLSPAEEQRWTSSAERRRKGEPLAYITGEKEFFGRSFSVDRSVLIPRPSTEGLVEMVLALMREKSEIPKSRFGPSSHSGLRASGPRTARPSGETRVLDAGIVGITHLFPWKLLPPPSLVDIGTGSGCIAITLACELPAVHIIATDISVAALCIAKSNAERHGVWEKICFLQGNLLEPIAHLRTPFLLVANPPYIPDGEKLPSEITAYEPRSALRAGPDGTAVLRPLLVQARAHPTCTGIVVECSEEQWYTDELWRSMPSPS